MKVLVVGGGGREHAICWKLKNEKDVEKVYCAPGNAGIADSAECVDIKDSDIENLVKFAKDNAIDLTVVGPEVPLVMGIVDAFEKEGLRRKSILRTRKCRYSRLCRMCRYKRQ